MFGDGGKCGSSWKRFRLGQVLLVCVAAICTCQAFLPPISFRAATTLSRHRHDVTNARHGSPLRAAPTTPTPPPAAKASSSTPPSEGERSSTGAGTGADDPVFGGGKSATEVVVVGAGVGGLATAARLAKAGCRVTVVEKNSEEDIGGRLNELVMDGGFRFDTGPSLLLLPDTYRETFTELGRDSDEFFEIRRVSPTYKVYFDDGDSVDLSDDEEEVRRQMDRLEEGAFDKYVAYLDVAQLNLEVGLPNFIEEKFTAARLPEFALGALFNSPLENHYGQLRRRFESPKMRALLSFQDLYVGLSPYNAPAVFSLLQAIELRDGVYYPMGGFARVGEALGTVCKDLGVKFRFDCPVSEVSVVGERGRVNSKGVVLESGEVLEADAVVCNADLPYAEKALLPDSVSRPFERSEYSSSVIAFYLCSNRRWPQLSHHTVFLSTDWKGSWESAFGELPGGELGDSFNFYVAAPARTDPSVCPAGSDAVMVLVPCPSIPDDYDNGDSGGAAGAAGEGRRERAAPDRGDWVRRAREGVIREMEASAGMEGFGESIVGEEVYAPWDWRDRYNLRRGAVFGLSHGLNQLSLLRPGPQHPTVKGLWFCGASSRPGNGVPLVLIGARQVAENVLKVVAGGNT